MSSEPIALHTYRAKASTLLIQPSDDDSLLSPLTPIKNEELTTSCLPLPIASSSSPRHEIDPASSSTTLEDDCDLTLDNGRFFELNIHLPTHSLEPPSYPLVNDRQPFPTRAQPPSYAAPELELAGRLDTVDPLSSDTLPQYAEEAQTEPKTLARSLWKWGWVCPLLWAIGMTILWIPLKPLEEEHDPEKAQTMDEMIAILRTVSRSFPLPTHGPSPRAQSKVLGFLDRGEVVVLAAVLIIAIVLTDKT
ncbi:MAG: hypothetical protein TREMPRED_004614 [Tremellales sp. Tagirdzhanova-0007]|nr:MAG: hypothetical protein TREMPRED_004614 [Tremellales sp. Tagirdzhanova-0007]